MSRKPYLVYYVGAERYVGSDRGQLLLPSLRNKYEVRFIVNPNRKTNWEQEGRKNQLNRAKHHSQMRKKYLAQQTQEEKHFD